MEMKEKVAWFVIGAAIGAGIALLYAPKSGKETRKYLRRKAEDARDTVVETTGQVRDTLVETGGTVLEAGRSVYRKGADIASEAREGAASVLDRGRKRVTG